jgi:hypothetical protein
MTASPPITAPAAILPATPGLQCEAGAVTLRQQLATAQARIKELEKPEGQPDPK